ncbi:SigB/SigF/SigG family RNA polymerase sigma factor [Actinocatenispora rupis]|uniref:SigB/SigF/SigG family RNA polymerase sigma factor n=1 Tax=Actinocatenispora rupis TaxID=519421 RepID=UPI0019409042|nr:SigB/SigF/SigG family RNA polymerase sigma factor [Actinocatenispora rupis]
MIEGFVPLADRLARRYASRGESLEDLQQVARVGLVKAVDGFDPELGGFLGYAVPTILGELKRYFRDQCWDVRVPRDLQDLRRRVHQTADELVQQKGHDPSSAEVAAELDVDRASVTAAVGADRAYSASSLNAPARQDGQGCEVGDLLGDNDEQVEWTADRVSLRPALDQLPERERRVLAMRFFDDLTQTQIAERIGLSQMHVSRLISRTLDGLRAWIDGECDHVEVCHERPHSTVA